MALLVCFHYLYTCPVLMLWREMRCWSPLEDVRLCEKCICVRRVYKTEMFSSSVCSWLQVFGMWLNSTYAWWSQKLFWLHESEAWWLTLRVVCLRSRRNIQYFPNASPVYYLQLNKFFRHGNLSKSPGIAYHCKTNSCYPNGARKCGEQTRQWMSTWGYVEITLKLNASQKSRVLLAPA